MYDRLNHAVIVFKTLKKNTLILLFVFCCNHNFFCTFQKSSSIGKDRHSDGDADLPVHCDVILHGADAGRNDGASLVWGCKFFLCLCYILRNPLFKL